MSTLSRTSLRAFLGPARSYLRDAIANQKRVAFVVGNESCDLDSTTSAIVYAYLQSSPFHSSESTTKDKPQFYVPVLNIPRADVRIRPEHQLLLKEVDVDPTQLITLDDIPLPNSSGSITLEPENSTWTLVDHNALTGDLGKHFSDRIVGCIDHHVDEEQTPKDAEPRVINKCGSCTSQVVEYCRAAWDRLSNSAAVISSNPGIGQHDDTAIYEDGASRRKWDAQLARLALASILVDTHNLTSEDKVTRTDQRAVEYLEAKISLGPGGERFNRKDFFERIREAKGDFSDLSVEEVLRKDYKMWETEKRGLKLGISSVIKPLSFLADKANGGKTATSTEEFIGEVKKFAKARSLTVYGVMTSFADKSGQFSRELLLYVNNQEAFADDKQFIKTVENKHGKELDLNEQTWASEHNDLRIWDQKNTKDSRKQVAPMLRETLETIA